MQPATPPPESPSDFVHLSASKVRRDLRLSLGILVAGVILVAVGSILNYLLLTWITNSSVSTMADNGIVLSLPMSVGSVFILVGAIFTGVNWSLLRKSDPSGGP